MKLLVKYTSITVSPYKKGDQPELEEELTITEPMWNITKMECYSIDGDTLYLPRSYNIKALEKIFGTYAIIDRSFYDTEHINFKLICNPRDNFQYKAMCFLACKDEFSKFANSSRFNLQLGTGIGKTYCAIAALWYYHCRGMVIIHLDNLINQWKDRIKKYTNIVDREIYIISGRESIDKLLKTGVSGYKIILASHGTLRSYYKSEGVDSLDELMKFMKIGIKIYDESHLEFANIINIDLHTNVRKNFYLTATAGRSDYLENRMYKQIIGSAPSLSLKLDKKDRKVVANVLMYDSHATHLEQSTMITMGRMNSSKYLDYIFFNKKAKMKTLKSFNISMKTLKDIDGQIAILVGIKKAVPLIRKYIEDEFPELKNDIGELHSDIKVKDKEEELKKKFIITTFKSFGTGTDMDEMLGIINFEPYASPIIAGQLIGRLRNKGYYMEIFDKSVIKRKKQFERVKKHIMEVVKKLITHDVL